MWLEQKQVVAIGGPSDINATRHGRIYLKMRLFEISPETDFEETLSLHFTRVKMKIENAASRPEGTTYKDKVRSAK